MGAGSRHHSLVLLSVIHKEHFNFIPLIYCRIDLAGVSFVMFAAVIKREKAVQLSLQTCLLILLFKLPLGSGWYSEPLTSPEVLAITLFGPFQTHH